ncbi:MAG: hypothetical protein K9K32_05750 [Halanaerobiales bacterium]|nr:hypothetical protein [Halanaerobiales bacterium]
MIGRYIAEYEDMRLNADMSAIDTRKLIIEFIEILEGVKHELSEGDLKENKKYTTNEMLKIFKRDFCDSSPLLCDYGDCYACEIENFIKWLNEKEEKKSIS